MPLALRFGLFLGLSQLLATLVVFAFGLHGSAASLDRAQLVESLVGFVLLMAVIGLSYRAARRTAATISTSSETGPTGLPFGIAAKFALLVALYGGTITGLCQYAYLAVINPGLRDLQRAQIMERVKDQLAAYTPEQVAQSTQQIEHATSAWARGVVYGVNTAFFAVILGLAYALIFRAAIRRDAAKS